MLESKSLSILSEALSHLEKGFVKLPDLDIAKDVDAIRDVMMTVAEKMKDNYPYFHPYYAGQQLRGCRKSCRNWLRLDHGILSASCVFKRLLRNSKRLLRMP